MREFLYIITMLAIMTVCLFYTAYGATYPNTTEGWKQAAQDVATSIQRQKETAK